MWQQSEPCAATVAASKAGSVAAGEVAAGDGGLADCGEGWYSSTPAGSHTSEWTAPMSGDEVTVSVAQADGPSDNYHTATVRRRQMVLSPGQT